VPSANRPAFAGELLAAAEAARLLADPVYLGVGVPRGDGRLVLVLPGLFGNDVYLHPLRTWLRRIGYRPARSTLAVNAGCPERLRQQVGRDLRRKLRDHTGPLALIGHSRGGILARALAGELQERVSHLILLGSPVGALGSTSLKEVMEQPPAAPLVIEASLRARRLLDPDCRFPECGCPFPQDLNRPLAPQTRVLSISSGDDPIVPPESSRMTGARNVQVSGTHSGLVYNPAVYREIAASLASVDT
jgi:triacylglycerol lipase